MGSEGPSVQKDHTGNDTETHYTVSGSYSVVTLPILNGGNRICIQAVKCDTNQTRAMQ
jgi:hypothetical protein